MPIIAIVLAAATQVALPPQALEATPDHPWRGYVVPTGPRTPPRPPSVDGAAIYPHHTIFMNRYGGHYTDSGFPDSRQNINSIGTGTITPFQCGDDAWHLVMQCLKKGFGKYDVIITDVDPGTNPHTETVVGGDPGQIGLPDGIAGIASMGCDQPYENGVSFAFSEVSGCSPNGLLDMCWSAAQETAHLFGLDHEIACQDFLTYDNACGYQKQFTTTASHCGEFANPPANHPEYGPHECFCTGGTMQNSDSMMAQIFGSKADGPPELVSMTPEDGDAVQAMFQIDAVVYDDRGFDGVEAFIDGTSVGVRATFPFRFTAPASVGQGQHTVKVVATDSAGHKTERQATVTVIGACSNTSDCPDGKVCDTGTGACKSGPGEPGGIGSTCAVSSECDSGLCAGGPDGEMRCVELCTPGDPSTCPDTFDCLPAGDTGACWPHSNPDTPGDDSGGGCGCDVGGRNGSAGGLAFALGALGLGAVLWRRRRR